MPLICVTVFPTTVVKFTGGWEPLNASSYKNVNGLPKTVASEFTVNTRSPLLKCVG